MPYPSSRNTGTVAIRRGKHELVAREGEHQLLEWRCVRDERDTGRIELSEGGTQHPYCNLGVRFTMLNLPKVGVGLQRNSNDAAERLGGHDAPTHRRADDPLDPRALEEAGSRLSLLGALSCERRSWEGVI